MPETTVNEDRLALEAAIASPYNYDRRSGGPRIWILNQGGERIINRRRSRRMSSEADVYYISRSSNSIRRLILRPFAILVFGYCLLQALDQNQNNKPSPVLLGNATDCGAAWTDSKGLSSSSSKDLIHSMLEQPKQPLPVYPAVARAKAMVPSLAPIHDQEDPEDAATNGNSPQLYGWEPSAYPDPILDPNRCGIAYLEEEEERERPQPGDFNMTGLRLCDPDWVLGGVYLEEIALAMHNFSSLFSDPLRLPVWSTPNSPPTPRRLTQWGMGNEEPDAPVNIKIVKEASSEEDDDDDEEEEAVETTKTEKKTKLRPVIQLAVATVRKVKVFCISSLVF
jgi:hypothetical protein